MLTPRRFLSLRSQDLAAEHESAVAVLPRRGQMPRNANAGMPGGRGLSMNDASDHLGGDRNENPDRYLVVLGAAAADLWSNWPQELQHTLFERAIILGHKASATRACASNWPSSCTTTTPAPSRADRARRRRRPGSQVVIAAAALRFLARRRAQKVDPPSWTMEKHQNGLA